MSEVRPNVLALDDAAFSKLYEECIAPALRKLETDRQRALATSRERWPWRIGGAVALGVVVAILTQNIFIAVIAGAFVYFAEQAYTLRPFADIGRTANEQTLAAVADATGCTYKADGFEADAYGPLMAYALLPDSGRTRFRDRFAGTHKRCDFSFCKAWLENRRKHGWYAVFEGHLIRIALRRSFNGTTILRRDGGQLDNWFESFRVSDAMNRFDLGAADLEQAFEGYTTDDLEAHALVDTAFLRRLRDLEHKFEGRDLRCAFDQGALLIAVESREPEGSGAEPSHFFKRLMIYESYRNAGIPVTANKAAEIDAALDENSKPTQDTMDGRLDTITRARAITGEVTEIMGLIDTVLARA